MALTRAIGRVVRLSKSGTSPGTFTFVILADPQLGLFERYVKNRPLSRNWTRELAFVTKAVHILNRLTPRPAFVVACGDLVDAQPGSSFREQQTKDLLEAFEKLDENIKLISLPGNHDVGDKPSEDGIRDYVETWGDDYYSLEYAQTRFLVLNSQLMWDDSNCRALGQQFYNWLDEQLLQLQKSNGILPIVLQHIPFFIDTADEPDCYFNIPGKVRQIIMPKLHAAGVRHVFTGHLHRNQSTTWLPSKQAMSQAMHLVTSSSVSVSLGSDPPGIRLVQVQIETATVRHKYWPLDVLDNLLSQGGQPDFDD